MSGDPECFEDDLRGEAGEDEDAPPRRRAYGVLEDAPSAAEATRDLHGD